MPWLGVRIPPGALIGTVRKFLMAEELTSITSELKHPVVV